MRPLIRGESQLDHGPYLTQQGDDADGVDESGPEVRSERLRLGQIIGGKLVGRKLGKGGDKKSGGTSKCRLPPHYWDDLY
jgi:hypothetical protein